ncbi:MAG: hypothetical protein KatS3mg068_1514 [Candidatus Sericytochromatia bacterium]|nr:MAG: hypothetical protein KatS3mg068_1514 [Candidatus Sericytochromatia bacterium]
MKRYKIMEISDISSVVLDLASGTSNRDYIFYPLTNLKKIRSIKIEYGKFNNKLVCPFKDDIKFNYNEKTLRNRYGIMGIIKYINKNNVEVIRPAVLFLSTKESYNVFNDSILKNNSLGRFLLFFSLSKDSFGSKIIVKKISSYNENSYISDLLKEMVISVDVDWIDYDEYTYNYYSYKKLKPNRDFNKKKLSDWKELLDNYLYSIGFPKKKKGNYSNKVKSYRKSDENKMQVSRKENRTKDLEDIPF